ncbi:M48 family metalloprotease [Cystobacter fuscus]|uniref:M48 family metalloprotease n=1 Tax=Cystobacter fuscus TaxID=43 RepID=UPI002B2CE54F|nr:M48 family metalloprotease [Cystobacter fuscus]
MRRHLLLVAVCLPLCGFGSCTRFIQADQQAKVRASEMRQECVALRERVITFEEERSFGDAVSAQWVSEGGGLTTQGDPAALHVQLNKIGRNLAAQSSRPHLPWVFGVLQSEGVNAVSGPGGYVFVSEGLLARLDNEAQLAGVLAHEIAHITGKHALNEYQDYLVGQCENAAKVEEGSAYQEATARVVSSAGQRLGQGIQNLSQVLPASTLRDAFARAGSKAQGFDFDQSGREFIRAVTRGFVERINRQGFRQEDEFAADLQAVELMAAAGYAPGEYVTFLAKLPERGGLSTPHPAKTERQVRLLKHLERLREQNLAADFTTPVDLAGTKVVPLRDELLDRRNRTATR